MPAGLFYTRAAQIARVYSRRTKPAGITALRLFFQRKGFLLGFLQNCSLAQIFVTVIVIFMIFMTKSDFVLQLMFVGVCRSVALTVVPTVAWLPGSCLTHCVTMP